MNHNFVFEFRPPWRRRRRRQQRQQEKTKTNNKNKNKNKEKRFFSRTCFGTFLALIVFSIVRITSMPTPGTLLKDISRISSSSSAASIRNNQNERQPQPQQQYETLWFITCETRTGPRGTDVRTWQFFANAVKLKHEREEEKRLLEHHQQQQQGGEQDSSFLRLPTVNVMNLCAGKRWGGFMTKYQYTAQFLDDLILSTPDNQKSLVIFSDSDVIFNVFGVSIGELLERYHVATASTRLPILIGAEPNCWYSGHCSQQVLDELYPEASKDRSNCPRYVNSGLYMGEATALRDMLRQILTEHENTKDQAELTSSSSSNTTTTSSSPFLIADTMRSLKITMKDDQGWMMAWYGIYGRGKLAVMDTRAMIFRNLIFGVTNATANGIFTCGPRDEHGYGCGVMKKIYGGTMDRNTSAIVTGEVPGCFPSMSFSMAREQNYVSTTAATTTTSSTIGSGWKSDNVMDGNGINRMYYETTPFILHANGVAKDFNKQVTHDVVQRIIANNLTIEMGGR